mmetsp:Transcript_32386/g.52386  ORF Transcript_32386/g.52386 Transcript_32386/m.52386 type:complete len:681 (+) Transcript_32386:93-2135(+)
MKERFGVLSFPGKIRSSRFISVSLALWVTLTAAYWFAFSNPTFIKENVFVYTSAHGSVPPWSTGDRPAGVSIVVAAMDREPQLALALKNWLSFPEVDEVILVDWSSLTPLGIGLAKRKLFPNRRLKLFRVENQTEWVLSFAYNLGIRYARYHTILKLDAETVLNATFFKTYGKAPRPGKFYTGNWEIARNENEIHLNGIIFAHAAHIANVSGYDERIQTYGWDDSDLYIRLEKCGLERINLDPDHLTHVHHGNVARVARSNRSSSSWDPDLETQRNRLRTERLKPWEEHFQGAQYSVYYDSRGSQVVLHMTHKPQHAALFLPEDSNKSIDIEAHKIRLLRHIRKVWNIQYSIQTLERLLALYNNGRKQFVVHVEEGMPNRLQAIAQAGVLAFGSNRQFRIIWLTDDYFQASFHDLFHPLAYSLPPLPPPPFEKQRNVPESDPNEWQVFSEFDTAEVVDGLRYIKIDMMDPHESVRVVNTNTTTRHLYVRLSAHWFVPEVPFINQSRFLQALRPSEPVQSLISSLTPPFLEDGQTIGVHIAPFLRDYEIDAFGTLVHEVLDERPDARFVIFSQSPLSLNLIDLAKHDRVKFLPDGSGACVNRHTVECAQTALASMYVLSKTSVLLGSYENTFTQIAVRLSMIPCYAKQPEFLQTREFIDRFLIPRSSSNDTSSSGGICMFS